jgi:hypothetical protein
VEVMGFEPTASTLRMCVEALAQRNGLEPRDER